MKPAIIELVNRHGVKFATRDIVHKYNLEHSMGSYGHKTDAIFLNVPLIRENKFSVQSVLLHELVHWTGGNNRLNRKFFDMYNKTGHFPNKILEAEEELIAQLGTLELARKFHLDPIYYRKIYDHYSKRYGSVIGIDSAYILDSVGKAVSYLFNK